MNPINNYIYNKETQIVKFYSQNTFNKRVGCLENFFSIFFTRGALVFKGVINVERFLNAVNDSFIDFTFILSTLYSNNSGVYAIYDGKKYSEQLEIEDFNDIIENIVLDNIVPNKIISKEQISGFASNFNSIKLKMGALKLSIFNDGFSIGYNFSHILFDHSSIVCYLKYLSHIYSFGLFNENFKLEKPVIFDASSIEFNNPFGKSLDQAREYSSNILKYTYKPSQQVYRNINENKNINKTILQIKFNLNEIEKLKLEINGLSRNDIISSILLKIYNLNDDNQNDDKYFTYGYTVNVRRLLNLKESNTIGNLIHQRRNPIKIKEIKEKSLLELATLNRTHVKLISKEDFFKFLGMCKIIQDENEDIVEYYNEPSEFITRTTNWTTFDYDTIKFDTFTPLSLKHYQLASVNINVISFDICNGKKHFTTQISIPSTNISNIKQYGENTKLYSIDNSFNLNN